MDTFKGFSPETIDFLWGIRMNNNRTWFEEHKKDYVNYLYEPMKALGRDLFAPFANKPGNILKVSRIYRDARMHPPVPYKESLWACIRQDVSWWGENPCLYFEIQPEGVSYGFFLWQPRVATLETMRQRWATDPDTFLNLIDATQKQTGIPISAQLYKRPKPAPIDALSPYYAWKGCISCCKEEAVSDGLFGPALGERAALLLEQLTPLYEYFNQFKV